MKIKVIPTGPIMANCYVLYDENSLDAAVIDPGSFDKEVRDAIEGLNVRYILLTHGHFDHILGAGDLQKATGAEILIHRLDEEHLTKKEANLLGDFLLSGEINLKADRLLEDGDKITFGGITLKVIHTPGHTTGSVTFADESEKILFTGDTMFFHGFGRTDFYGSNESDMKKSLERLMNLEGDWRVYPGHDRATTLENERAFLRCIL